VVVDHQKLKSGGGSWKVAVDHQKLKSGGRPPEVEKSIPWHQKLKSGGRPSEVEKWWSTTTFLK
jgi:hypothetical protein